MKKEYDHKKIEKKWQATWDKKKTYKTLDNSKKPKFFILDMFPYVSGEGIHVGHPKGYIATDVVSRMKRMQGFNVLHPMGFDAFGLPAENYAIKTKTNPVVSVAKNINTFKKQLEIIGFDYDWSREVNTSDPKFYKWTQWIFLKLLERGLAYESNEPVNWCPTDKTVLANEDVEDGKCERCGTVVEKKPIRQWVLKITDYADRLLSDLDELDWPESIKESQRNWIGRSEGAEICFKVEGGKLKEEVKIFTTRPDTIYGATYLVLAPEHEIVSKLKSQITNLDEVHMYALEAKSKNELDRTKEEKQKTGVELKGIMAINPATNEKIPVWVADYVLPHYGTGAIMAVPAHDERDFEFARKFNLPIKQVIIPVFGSENKKENSVDRNTITGIVKSRDGKKVLMLKWKEYDWFTGVVGGIEGDESPEKAAEREVLEETGYKTKAVYVSPLKIESHYFAEHKNEWRARLDTPVVLELVDDEPQVVSPREKEKHEAIWVDIKEVFASTMFGNNKLAIELGLNETPYVGFKQDHKDLLINSGRFDGMGSEEAKKKIVDFVGGNMKVTYKLRDWVFSRQRYWGEPIPVLRDGSEVVPLKEKDLPLKLPKVKFYEPTGTAESPLAGLPNWMNVKVGKKILRRESNTMPQWAGSSWYYLRYMDPQNNKALVDKKKEKYWNMVDLYVGGAEHATRHLIYARFWHKFLFDIGVVTNKEPFKRLQHVGLIIASDGRKMSKRWKNVVNPDNVISTYGSDTLRLYEMFMGPFDQSVSWNDNSLIGPRRFLERVWKIAGKISKSSSSSVQKSLHKAIKKVSEDISSMRFNTAVSSLMILQNEIDNGEISLQDYKKFLQILAPFAPHITEELWSVIGEKKSIHISTWPEWDERLIVDTEVKIIIQVNGKLRSEMMLSVEATEDVAKNKALADETVIKYLAGGVPKKIIYVKNRLVNIVL